MRLPLVVVVLTCAVTGCWTDDALVDGAFTPEQWAVLHDNFTQAPHEVLRPGPGAKLGQALFFDPALSGPSGTVSCATCHDPAKWFIDSRAPNNVSLGARWTGRNSMSVVNSTLKEVYSDQPSVMTWNGKYATAGGVLELAILRPMCSSRRVVADLMRTKYRAAYTGVFGEPPSGCRRLPFEPDQPTCDAIVRTCTADNEIFDNVASAFEDYFRALTSLDAPFDRYIAGDHDAISDAAKRGFGVFVGRGGCFECHRGPLLSDLEFHNTGVPQRGDHVPLTDYGVAMQADDARAGEFLTPSLRQVAQTGPYMHDGVFASLGEVIDFYRHGGVPGDYSGARDPRIVPMDLTDDDAQDLEAFLQTLTGAPVAAELRKPPPPACDPMGACP